MKIGFLTSHPKSYKTKRFVEEAEKRGHEAVIINYTKCYCDISKSNPHIYYKGEQIEGVDAIVPQIAVDTTNYGAAIIRQFEVMNVFTATGSLAFIRTRDKIRSLQLLARRGLDTPKTVFAHSTTKSTFEKPEELIRLVGGAPLIIKVAQGSMGRGVMLAETNKSARSAIEAFYSQGVDIMIQEYIEESEGSDIRVFVVGGKIVGAIKREAAEGEFRSNIYQGGSAKPTKLKREERLVAIRAARALHLGIAGVDLVQAERGPLVMEVNACPNIKGIEAATDKNIAGAIVQFVEDNQLKKKKTDRVGA